MKIKRYDAQINVSVQSDFKSAVEEMAAKQKLSMSEFVRAAIEERIKQLDRSK